MKQLNLHQPTISLANAAVVSMKTISRLLILSLSLAGGTQALAADVSATGDVNVTVSNAITFGETVAMDFGTFYALGNNNTAGDTNGGGAINATQTPNDSAYLDLALNGTITAADGTTAKMASISGTGTPGQFTVSAAAFNAAIQFTSTIMLDADDTAATANFTDGTDSLLFTDLIIDIDNDNVADNDLIGDGDSTTIHATTDGAGGLVIRAAGRLYTTYSDTTDNKLYGAGAYTGTYTLNVSY